MDGSKKITIKIISVFIILFSIHSCKTLNRTSISLYEADSTFVYPTRNVIEEKSTVLLNTDSDKIECNKVLNKIKTTEWKAPQSIDTIQPTTVTVKTEKLKSMTDSISLLKNEIYVLKRINEAISNLYVQLRMVEKPTLSTTKSTVKQIKTDNLPSIKTDSTIQKTTVKKASATKKVVGDAKTIQIVDSTKAIKKDSTVSIKKDSTLQKSAVEAATVNKKVASSAKTKQKVDGTKSIKNDNSVSIKKESTMQQSAVEAATVNKKVASSAKTKQKADGTKVMKTGCSHSIKKDSTMQKTAVKVATITKEIADSSKTILIVDSTKVMKTDSTIFIKKDSTIQKASVIGDNII